MTVLLGNFTVIQRSHDVVNDHATVKGKVQYCAAFVLKCPEPSQWSLRASSHCPDPSKYSCLKNDLIIGYSENCTVFDYIKAGRKHVLRGGLDADVCSPERYQPGNIIFYTNVSTNCVLLLSSCNEEGQVVNDNGNRSTDVTCRCDYSKGYAFLVKPRNTCFCVPSEEDCSCFLKICPHSTLNLSPDYECINSRQNMSTSKCGSIMNGRENKDEGKGNTHSILNKDNISNPGQWIRYVGLIGFVFCLGKDLTNILGVQRCLLLNHMSNLEPVSNIKYELYNCSVTKESMQIIKLEK
ncbi:unnamed protein product [Mytilus edulis]|uniref:Uncharacterized protein n=1 Tax=Mytilus edulis TaxID=6550 RepID=A0A8S3PS36_MYTED|nr:unnamed protein product [Mytilus edulis]